ncbi:MAG: class I SAM-dependent methyltransferase [Planctomycetes bacterium]|nr:class I SAM-dependent methyltransferase [Planctomycetota bacterium]
MNGTSKRNMDHPARRGEKQVSARPRPLRWRERALQWLDFSLGRFLDFGCGPCGLMEQVYDRCVECHGVDVDSDKIEEARAKHANFTLGVIALDGKTHYPDDYFDTIAIIEVIEHVPDESTTLAELARILRPGGRLLLTTPHRGWLTFLDVGNFKFVFPRLHRFIHVRIKGDGGYYQDRFVRGAEKGLIGDISVSNDRRPWHRHYKPGQITTACPPSLVLQKHAVYFPCLRAMMAVEVALRTASRGRIKNLPRPLAALERRLSRIESRTGDQLVMLFTKKT